MSDPTFIDPAVAGGALSAVVGLIGYIVHKNDKRLDDVENKASKAATADALEVHRKEDRENFQTLFEGQADIRKDVNDQFAELHETLHGIHVDILNKMK